MRKITKICYSAKKNHIKKRSFPNEFKRQFPSIFTFFVHRKR